MALKRIPSAANSIASARVADSKPLEAPVTIATLNAPVGASGVVLLDECNGVDMIVAP
jgi:hypothetical protein